MLWLERLSALTGTDRLSDRLTGTDRWGPYILFWTVLFIDVPVLLTLEWFGSGGTHFLLRYPVWLLYPVGLTFAIWAARQLRDEFRSTVDTITRTDPGFDADRLARPLPRPAKAGLALAVAALHISYLFTADFAAVLSVRGLWTTALQYGLFMPLYYIVFLDLAAVFLGIHVVLPLRVRLDDLTIDYHDPLTFEEVEAIGTLLKRSSQLYFLGLLIATIIAAWQAVAPASTGPVFLRSVSPQKQFALGIAWLFGAVLFVFPVYWLHGHMKREKRRVRDEILEQLQGASGEEPPLEHPAVDAEDIDEFIEQSKEFHRYTSLYFKLDRLDAAPTYPVDYRIVRRIVILAVLPFLINILTAVVQSSL